MAKRAFHIVVLFFAVCGFLFVPLGKRTAIEHVQAILGTPAAQQAGRELKSGIVRLFDRLRSRASEAADEDGAVEEERRRAEDVDARPRQRLTPRSPKGEKPRTLERKLPATAAQAPR